MELVRGAGKARALFCFLTFLLSYFKFFMLFLFLNSLCFLRFAIFTFKFFALFHFKSLKFKHLRPIFKFRLNFATNSNSLKQSLNFKRKF